MTPNFTPIPFEFESTSVRAFDRDGEIWFVAADVCAALSIRNPRDAVSKLDDDERGVVNSDTLGGSQEMTVISEPGLYRLTMTSRKAAAKRFTRWVTHEVLPAIRTTGSYEAKPDAEEPSTGALPNGLTADQQDAIKALVKTRVEELPQDKRAKAAITCWSALKSKFGRTYKEISPDQFTEAVSLVARLPLQGELIEAQPQGADQCEVFRTNLNTLTVHLRYITEYWTNDIGPAVRSLNPMLHSTVNAHMIDAQRLNTQLIRRLQ